MESSSKSLPEVDKEVAPKDARLTMVGEGLSWSLEMALGRRMVSGRPRRVVGLVVVVVVMVVLVAAVVVVMVVVVDAFGLKSAENSFEMELRLDSLTWLDPAGGGHWTWPVRACA